MRALFLAAVAALAGAPAPDVRWQAPALRSGERGFTCFRIPTLLALPPAPSHLLLLAEGRGLRSPRTCSDHGDVVIVQKRSTDGRTWSNLSVIVDEYSPDRKGDGPEFCCKGRPGCKGCSTGNPAPIWDVATGRVLLLYARDNMDIFLTTSTDMGVSYSAPTNLSATLTPPLPPGFAAPGPPGGLRLAGGRLVQASYVIGHGSFALYSDNGGARWRAGLVVPNLASLSGEAAIAELPATTPAGVRWLAMTLRTARTQRSLAFSSDQGQSWSNATDVTAAPGGVPYSSATCQGSLAEVGRQLVAAHPSTRNGSCPHLRCNLSLWTAPVLGRGDGWGLRSGFGSGSDTPLLGQWQPRVSLDRGYSAYSTLLPTPGGGVICAYEFSQTCELFKPPRCTAVPGSSGIMVASVEGLAVPYVKTDDAAGLPSPSCMLNNESCPIPRGWEPDWSVINSTAMMATLSDSPGGFWPKHRWGYVTLDWSAGYLNWVNPNPAKTTCEATSAANCARLKAAGKVKRCGIYHNMELALEWLESERAVMDEAHVKAGWFLTYPNGSVFDRKQQVGGRIGPRMSQYIIDWRNIDAADYFVGAILNSTFRPGVDATFTDDLPGVPAEHPEVQPATRLSDAELASLQRATQTAEMSLASALAISGKFCWDCVGGEDGPAGSSYSMNQLPPPNDTAGCARWFRHYCRPEMQVSTRLLADDVPLRWRSHKCPAVFRVGGCSWTGRARVARPTASPAHRTRRRARRSPLS